MKLLPQGEWGGTAVGDQYASVQKILDGTLRAIRSVGARRLSMRDISDASNVSRGTLYRYFASKEEVLAAVSEYVCVSFELGIAEVADSIADPMERFKAVMQFFAHFTIDRSPDRIFEVEPAFHLEFLRTHFARHQAAVRDALEPTLDSSGFSSARWSFLRTTNGCVAGMNRPNTYSNGPCKPSAAVPKR